MQTATRTPSRNGHAEAAPTQRISRAELYAAQRQAIEAAYESCWLNAEQYAQQLRDWQARQQLHAEAQAVAGAIG